jgi:hypothetical protein
VAVGEAGQEIERQVAVDGDRQRVGHGVPCDDAATAKFSLPAMPRGSAKRALQKSARICYNLGYRTTVLIRRNGLGTAHFFFDRRVFYFEGAESTWTTARSDDPPMGFELVDWEMQPRARLVRVFIDKLPRG